MPAAAVIPAPIGYIKVVAVKKLVVEFLPGFSCVSAWFTLRGIRHPAFCGTRLVRGSLRV